MRVCIISVDSAVLRLAPLYPVCTIQPVVKPVVTGQPVWQQVVSCKRGFTLLFSITNKFTCRPPTVFWQSIVQSIFYPYICWLLIFVPVR